MPKNDRIPAKEGPVGELASGQEVFLGDELDLGLEIQVDGEWILSELRLRGTAVGGPKPSIERPQGLPPTTLTVMPKDPLGQPPTRIFTHVSFGKSRMLLLRATLDDGLLSCSE